MKVVVLSFCGNVGKSAIAKNLLLPRLNIPAGCLFDVETINSGLSDEGIDATKVRAKHFDMLIDELMKTDSAVVDVGASNVEEFFLRMEQAAGSHEEFDYFIIPVTKSDKAQTEGKKTVLALAALGVPKKKIKIVFNMVPVQEYSDIDLLFSDIISLKAKYASVNTDAVIFESPAFSLLTSYKLSIPEVMDDPIDYRKDLAAVRVNAPDKEAYYRDRVSIKRHTISVVENLDKVFAQLSL